MTAPLAPEREAEIRERLGSTLSARMNDVKALLAELDRVRAELADFSGRVNEPESQLCECEPIREHRDLRRPAFYQHAADCPVNGGAS